ncbi:MAG: hypothetical protein WBW41_01360 [Verrucomicrobiia bacterium]
MKMTTKIKMQRWIPALITAAALAGFASLCQAQVSPITYDFSSGLEGWTDFSGIAGNTVSWNATGGPTGGGCAEYTFDGTGSVSQYGTLALPGVAFSPSINSLSYATVDVDVNFSGGTEGPGGSGGYGYMQIVFQDTSYNWHTAGFATIYDSGWQHYTYSVPYVAGGYPVGEMFFQIMADSSSSYSAPTTVEFANVVISPLANPYVLDAFTNSAGVTYTSYGLAGSWDGTEDAPYYNPITGAGPTSITPAGSLELQATPPYGTYPGGQLYLSLSPALYEWVGVDVFYDGPQSPTTNDYGAMQFSIANAASPYNWVNIGNVSFNASMIGTWTHFNFPCAASGVTSGAGFAIQAYTPGGEPGTTPFNFHIDNIVLWNPETIPTITGITPGSPAGVQMTVDADGTLNLDDQEGFCTPTTNNAAADFFWIGQTPATYSFSLTNCPAPAAAPSFDAHIYVWNGDSITAVENDFGYNQTYSGVNWNAGDMISLDVQNGTNGGVVAQFGWKTNLFNGAESNQWITTFTFPTMASMNGTWALNFTDNTHGNITAPDQSVNSFTVPDFSSDPDYTANFNPATSAISFGVFKNGNVLNNGQSITINNVTVANSTGTIYNDSFGGPGLDANNNWQVAEYYQYAADRTIWIPAGTAWWIKWDATALGWSVQSAPDLTSWADAGVTYTYVDTTGTNTLGAIPSASLPAGNAAFFRMMHP